MLGDKVTVLTPKMILQEQVKFLQFIKKTSRETNEPILRREYVSNLIKMPFKIWHYWCCIEKPQYFFRVFNFLGTVLSSYFDNRIDRIINVTVTNSSPWNFENEVWDNPFDKTEGKGFYIYFVITLREVKGFYFPWIRLVKCNIKPNTMKIYCQYYYYKERYFNTKIQVLEPVCVWYLGTCGSILEMGDKNDAVSINVKNILLI